MKNEFVQHIHDLLSVFAEVECYRFFGGFGFKLGGIQFAMVMRNTLYFVVDSDLRDFFVSMGSELSLIKLKREQKNCSGTIRCPMKYWKIMNNWLRLKINRSLLL